MEYNRVLVFVEFPDPASATVGLVRALSYLDVTLVGHREVPADADPEAARQRHADDMRATLDAMTDRFESEGIRVDHRVEFSRDATATRDRLATEGEYDAVLLPQEVSTVGQVLVPLRNLTNADRIADFVDLIDREKIIRITLLHVVTEDAAAGRADKGREVLREMKDMLVERGVNPHAIGMEVKISDDPALEIVRTAHTYDLVVLGETKTSVDTVFGDLSNQVIDRTGTPVLVVTN